MEASSVASFLDTNPAFFRDYFLRKGELGLVKQWLTQHGYMILVEGATGRRSPFCLGPPSRRGSGGASSPVGEEAGGGRRRNEFARAKSRSVFQRDDAAPPHASRRSSLKEMRKFASLPPNTINILSLLIESKVKLPRHASKHFEMKRELRRLDDRAFFLDIVKDIANDLDLKSLTQKISENVSILLDAEAASLFVVEGPRGKQSLVSKVFDIPSGTNFLPSATDAVEVPWGKGILGSVAETGVTVNVERAEEDPRYKDGVDRILGKRTETLLCMPVRTPGGEEVIGVAQVVNKHRTVGGFSAADEKLLETYLQFVGIALTNAQILEVTRREYDRNRSLLEVVHDLFEEQTSLEQVISKIMQRAQRLLKCERAAVLLLDDPPPHDAHELVFSKLFELSAPSKSASGYSLNGHQDYANVPGGTLELSCSVVKLAEQVALSGERVNIAEVVEVERSSGGNLKSLLGMPIRNRHAEIIGVATIVNKVNQLPFDDQDEQLFEAFTIFCGLGINNTLTYAELEVAIARQKVAIEVLSYHAAASSKEVQPFLRREVPTAGEWSLGSLSFDDFSLKGDEMVVGAVRMFLDLNLVSRFKIDYPTVIRWLLTVQRNYRDVPYHNWRHAFNVAQVMFASLTSCGMRGSFEEVEVLGMFVACLCHDLDHRGTNNSFQAKTASPLALLYGTHNTMEHHHFNHAVMIINSEGHNIFCGLTGDEYGRVMNVLKQSILATDLTIYFQRRKAFFEWVGKGECLWEEEGKREVLRSMLMTASDLAASTKTWGVQRRVAELVTAEFFAQGDQERQQLQITPPASMDREREDELPELQMTWIRDICLPLYQGLTDMNAGFGRMRDGARENMLHWATLVHPLQSPLNST